MIYDVFVYLSIYIYIKFLDIYIYIYIYWRIVTTPLNQATGCTPRFHQHRLCGRKCVILRWKAMAAYHWFVGPCDDHVCRELVLHPARIKIRGIQKSRVSDDPRLLNLKANYIQESTTVNWVAGISAGSSSDRKGRLLTGGKHIIYIYIYAWKMQFQNGVALRDVITWQLRWGINPERS